MRTGAGNCEFIDSGPAANAATGKLVLLLPL